MDGNELKGTFPQKVDVFGNSTTDVARRKQSQDENLSYRLAFTQNCNVDREVWAHPKTSWLNCRCCAKAASGKSK